MRAPTVELSGNRFQAFINYVAPEEDTSISIVSVVNSFMSSHADSEIEAVTVSTYGVPNEGDSRPSVGLVISIVARRRPPVVTAESRDYA